MRIVYQNGITADSDETSADRRCNAPSAFAGIELAFSVLVAHQIEAVSPIMLIKGRGQQAAPGVTMLEREGVVVRAAKEADIRPG